MGVIFLIAAGEGTAWAQWKFAVARYIPWGELDQQGFGCPMPAPGCNGVPGATFTDITGANEAINGLILESATFKPVGAGYATDKTGNRQFAIAKYLRMDGSPDLGFGTLGSTVTSFNVAGFNLLSSYATSLAEDTSRTTACPKTLPNCKKFVVAGVAWPNGCCADSRIALVRYLENGDLDSTFGMGGRVSTDIPITSYEFPSAVAVDSDGKIWIAGGAGGKVLVARYTNTGVEDPTFGCPMAMQPCSGWYVDDFVKSADEFAYALVLVDHKAVVAGKISDGDTASNRFLLARYAPDGDKRDPTFGCAMAPMPVCSGFRITDFAGSLDEYARSLVVDNMGNYVAAGQVSPVVGGNRQFALVRYTPKGVEDAGFGPSGNGQVVTDFPSSTDEAVYGLTVNTSGQLVAVGAAFDGGVWKIALAQYHSTANMALSAIPGDLDKTFGSGCNMIPNPCTGRILTGLSAATRFGSIAIDRGGAGWIVVAGAVQ
jgi:uncharacterized delta-60 repeat protein